MPKTINGTTLYSLAEASQETGLAIETIRSRIRTDNEELRIEAVRISDRVLLLDQDAIEKLKRIGKRKAGRPPEKREG